MLVTRPEPGATATARRVAALGYVPVVAPLLGIERLATELPAPSSLRAILATSGNAVGALPPAWRLLPLLAVGDATARRARAAGFDTVASADGDADALADLVAHRHAPDGKPLLLASGMGQGEALANTLRARGFDVVRREVYAARPVGGLPEAAARALEAECLLGALFFSAETARAFVRLAEMAGLSRHCACVEALAIGRPAAVALRALPWRSVRVAAGPTQDEMLALLA